MSSSSALSKHGAQGLIVQLVHRDPKGQERSEDERSRTWKFFN
jgi:hypothetical protein